MFHLWAQTMTGLTAVVRRNRIQIGRNFLLFPVRRENIDVSNRLPHLATYLGHVPIVSTHYYLRRPSRAKEASSLS